MTPDATHRLAEMFRRHLALPDDAVLWLIDMWETIQTLDDLVDGVSVERPALDDLIWRVLVRLPDNAFYRAHQATLAPVIALCILKWQASDQRERAGVADAKTYMWRAGYYDLVLMAVLLCHGMRTAQEAALFVMDMYGESLEDYLKEFDHA